MSYLRLDNKQQQQNVATIMTADGRIKYGTNDGVSLGHQLAYQYMPQRFTTYSRMYGAPATFSPDIRAQGQSNQNAGQKQLEAKQQMRYLNIRGIYKLMQHVGYPDITDAHKGGIAIWSSATLRSRGYKFLHRVEIIDESVPSLTPVKHFSNIYIWVKVRLGESMIDNVTRLSSDIFYDRGKELLIVRSDTLDTAVAQAALVGMYSKGQVSYYDIMNNDMLETYYTGVRRSKARKAIYTVLNNLSKR